VPFLATIYPSSLSLTVGRRTARTSVRFCQRYYRLFKGKICDAEHVRDVLMATCWECINHSGQPLNDKAIDQLYKRISPIIQANGGHVEHRLDFRFISLLSCAVHCTVGHSLAVLTNNQQSAVQVMFRLLSDQFTQLLYFS